LFAILLFIRKEQNLLRASIALLIPGGIIQMAWTNAFYYRKEIIFHVLLITGALLFLSVKHMSNVHRLRQYLAVSVAVLIVAFSIVMQFIHEAFIFLTLPAILLIFRAHLAGSRVFWYICIFLISIHILLFGVLSYFKGDPNVAAAIWQRVPV